MMDELNELDLAQLGIRIQSFEAAIGNYNVCSLPELKRMDKALGRCGY